MLSNAKLVKILAIIEEKSKQKITFNYGVTGGNIDDAYDAGLSDGEVSLAQELQNIVDGPEPTSVINA